MISFTTGEIQLFHSKYILSPSLDRLNFEKTFPNKIVNYPPPMQGIEVGAS